MTLDGALEIVRQALAHAAQGGREPSAETWAAFDLYEGLIERQVALRAGPDRADAEVWLAKTPGPVGVRRARGR